MKYLLRFALAIPLAFLPLAVLTAQENPEAELALCYQRCLLSGMEVVNEVWRENEALEPPVHFCIGMQELAYGLLGCRRACDDYAVATMGDRNAGRNHRGRWALSRFFNRVITPMQHTGLWISYADTPTLADDDLTVWADACADFYRKFRAIQDEIECRDRRDSYQCRCLDSPETC